MDLQRDTRDVCIWKKECMRTWRGGSCLQVKGRVLRSTQQYFDLGFGVSGTVKEEISVV